MLPRRPREHLGTAMLDAVKRLIKRLLRVPPEPHQPAGGPGSMRLFRAAPGFFRYRLLGWGFRQGGALLGLVGGVVALRNFLPPALEGLFILEWLAVAFFVVQLPFSFLMVVLDYEYRWYMVTDRSLRIREGLLKVQEKTMTFSNIQNVSIRQGPVQRLFGISDVEVRTAGGGGSSSSGKDEQGLTDNLHLGYFRGVANAAEIRDTILAHLKRLRSAGLGDPDEPPLSALAMDALALAAGGDLLQAGRQLLVEARALRRAAGAAG